MSTFRINRRTFACTAIAVAVGGLPVLSSAQGVAYPSKPIQFFVGFPPGGGRGHSLADRRNSPFAAAGSASRAR